VPGGDGSRAEKDERRSWVMVDLVPVLSIWAVLVAQGLGFEHYETLTLGRAVAGLNAYSKGVSLNLFPPTPKKVQEQRRKMYEEETVTVDLLHRAVPAKHNDDELPAVGGGSSIESERFQELRFRTPKMMEDLVFIECGLQFLWVEGQGVERL
jgi:hypothetical protein